MTGGTLNIGYVPSADSTPIAAQISANTSLSGTASLSVHTLQVDSFRTLTVNGATLSFDTINLMPHGINPASIDLEGDLNFSPFAGGTGTIANGAGTGNSGHIDLGGANRVFNVADGAANVDLAIEVPISNGSLTKTGPGTLALYGNNSFNGDSVVQEGILSINDPMLPDHFNVLLSTGGILNLDFTGAPDVINSLSIDGSMLPIGIWGSVGSGAQFTSPLITGTGLLQVTSTATPGDFDGDGDVDGDDLSEWQAAYNNTAGGDADDDGDTDGRDFLTWQRNFTGANPLAAAAAVPEPNSLAMLLSALVAIGLGKRASNRFSAGTP